MACTSFPLPSGPISSRTLHPLGIELSGSAQEAGGVGTVGTWCSWLAAGTEPSRTPMDRRLSASPHPHVSAV